MRIILLASLAFLAMFAGSAGAQDWASSDKSQYTLIDPTPDNRLRRYDADVDGDIRSPHTLDAGHFVLESSLIGYTQSRASTLLTYGSGSFSGSDYFRFTEQDLSAGQTWLKVGLTNWADLEFMVGGYVDQHFVTEDRSIQTFPQIPACAFAFPPTCPAVPVPTTFVSTGRSSDHARGMSDSEARLKINLLGNDGGPFALAVIPFSTFPTGSTTVSEGGYRVGVIVPLEVNLLRHIQFTVQTEMAHTFDGFAYVHSYSEVLGAARITYRRWAELVPYVEASGGGIVGNNPYSGFGISTPATAVEIGAGIEGKIRPGLILFVHGDAGVTYGSPHYSGRFGIAVRY